MTDKRTLLVGVDLCEDYSQITCFSTVSFEPESVCINGDTEKYLVPTALYYNKETTEWLFGEEAKSQDKKTKGVLINNLLERASKEAEVNIGGRFYKPEELLERYLKRLLGLLKIEYPNNTIRKLVVTVKEKNMVLIQNIYTALQNLGISKVRASVENHEQSFVQYAMNQPKELRVNDVALFDFDESGLMYYQISINRRTSPHSILLKKKDFRETLSYDMLEDELSRENASYVFESIALNVLHKQIIGTIYVTGKGFQGSWCRRVLKNLCIGRRVFVGQNLYAKGAGYGAREKIGEGKLKEYLYLGEETVRVNVSMPLYTNSQMVQYPLVTAGAVWYNATKVISFIPDNELEVELIIENAINHQETRHFITMEGLHQLARRTRIELSVEFMDVNTMVVTLRDKGFGDLYPSSNRVWEKMIQISEHVTGIKNETSALSFNTPTPVWKEVEMKKEELEKER